MSRGPLRLRGRPISRTKLMHLGYGDDDGDNPDTSVGDGGSGDGGDGGGGGDGGDGGQCLPLAGACQVGSDCCSTRCEGMKCVAATCVAQGLTCANNTDCCSGSC